MRSFNSVSSGCDIKEDEDEGEELRRVSAQRTTVGNNFSPISSLQLFFVKKQPKGKLLETASAEERVEGYILRRLKQCSTRSNEKDGIEASGAVESPETAAAFIELQAS